jgi:hypothetical protein
VIDTDRSGQITVGDLVSFVKRSAGSAYFQEALNRLHSEGGEPASSGPFGIPAARDPRDVPLGTSTSGGLFASGFTLVLLGGLVYGGYRLMNARAGTSSRRLSARKVR